MSERAGGMSELHALLRGYFHQDWPDDHGTWQATLERYLDETPSPRLRQLLTDIAEALERHPGEEALSGWFDEVGAAIHPPGIGWTHRRFLHEVRARAEARLATNGD